MIKDGILQSVKIIWQYPYNTCLLLPEVLHVHVSQLCQHCDLYTYTTTRMYFLPLIIITCWHVSCFVSDSQICENQPYENTIFPMFHIGMQLPSWTLKNCVRESLNELSFDYKFMLNYIMYLPSYTH
jgi:hypothetical protein